ncbi:hypothetical protein ACS191_10975 [Klebsiella pneumoniae]|uniref:hypothetical protein n=1 Tax=Klebsiella pneumoniae TaxID=573 RepID=UPI00108306FE|nr:hypothetical protein [Klebsiella pneumoniae]VFZ24048.1 Uncharacterised protein [Klebsiella pneumoniae]
MTDITELAQREKFEAWWEREYKHLESSKYTDAVPHIKYGFWMAYQAGGAELVEALEKAQQRNGELETYSKTAIEFREAARDKNRHLKLELEIAEKRIAELEDAEQKLCAANVTLDSRAELAERQLAEMVSRTVTIKFTPIPVEELGNVRDGKKHPYMFGAGYNAAVIHCESVIQQELDAKGIKWEAE